MKNRTNKERIIEEILNIKLKDDVKTILPEEKIEEHLSSNLILPDTFHDYAEYREFKEDYISTKKYDLVSKTGKEDVVSLLLFEKLAQIMFNMLFLEEKFKEDITLVGNTPKSTRLTAELEYVKTLLIIQMSAIGTAVGIRDNIIQEIYIDEKRRAD